MLFLTRKASWYFMFAMIKQKYMSPSPERQISAKRIAKVVVVAVIAGLVGGFLGWFFETYAPVIPMGAVIGAMCGVIVGAVAVLAFGGIHEVVLQSATVKIPGGPELKFAFTDKQRQVGWKIFTEAITRIVTQPLDGEDGRNDAALASIHQFFVQTRKLLQEMPPSPKPSDRAWTVELLAFKMLNEETRPFLAKWHAIFSLDDDKEVVEHPNWEHREAFRKELDRVRRHIFEHARALGELVGVAHLDSILPPVRE